MANWHLTMTVPRAPRLQGVRGQAGCSAPWSQGTVRGACRVSMMTRSGSVGCSLALYCRQGPCHPQERPTALTPVFCRTLGEVQAMMWPSLHETPWPSACAVRTDGSPKHSAHSKGQHDVYWWPTQSGPLIDQGVERYSGAV